MVNIAKSNPLAIALACGGLLPGPGALAVDLGSGVTLEGGLTAVYLLTDEDSASSEFTASVDVVSTVEMGPGSLTIYLEGATTLDSDGVATILRESNGDGGGAADDDGDGRIQLSELFYRLPVGPGELSVGLVDASAYLDASDVANDETTQFLGNTFINNPTISFPDYTLGAAYEQPASGAWPGLVVWVGRSHGLGDDDTTYGALFDGHFDADGDGREEADKGVFVGLEGVWTPGSTKVRVGLWGQTAENPELSGTGDEPAFGIYTSIDGEFHANRWNVRVGAANPEVSAAAGFVSLATSRTFSPMVTAGVAASYTVQSDDATTGEDTVQAEIYLRYQPLGALQLTPVVQYISNSGFSDGLDALVAGMRMNLTF